MNIRPGNQVVDWTASQIAELSILWGNGLTAAEIGRRMGISKSAVIGKAHRLHLPGRPSPIRRHSHPWQRKAAPASAPRQAKPATATPKVVPLPDAVYDPVTRVRAKPSHTDEYAARGLSKHLCKFPLGDPKDPDFHFCGSRAVNGKPYCAPCCAKAYVRLTPKAKAAA